MTSPAQLEIGYHPTFASSFWTYPDYRTGATVLYARMQDGLDENDEVLALLRHRAEVERETARLLGHVPEPVPAADPLFAGASSSERGGLHASAAPTARTLRLLVSEFATSQADSHFRAAKQMEATIVGPFSEWIAAHAERMQASYDKVDEALTAMEKQSTEVARQRTAYETKCRLADEAEDDARFAPGAQPAPPASGTRRLSLGTRKEEPEAESAPLDPQRLQRRETLRQQFGFKPRREEDEKAAHEEPEAPVVGLQRSSTRIGSYLTRAVGKMGDSQALAQVRAAVSGLADPRHVRLRRDAELAEQHYQESVAHLDALRCRAEQTLFHQYQNLQRWEGDRVVALQKVLTAYQRAVAPLADDLHASVERTQLLPGRLQPAAHLQHLMQEYKTGPFRPAPVAFKPYYHDDLNAVAGLLRAGFGMDLVSTAKGAALAAQESSQRTGHASSLLAMPTLPPVLHALLSALQRSYADRARWVPKDGPAVPEATVHAEQRRIWLYEVPLHVTHALRTRLIEHVGTHGAHSELAADAMLDTVDAPVLAATVKLWALELDTPLLPYSSWDEIAEIYDAADIRYAAQQDAPDADPAEISTPIVQGLGGVLARLPKLHLACLDAWIAHLYKLVKDTPTDEAPGVYTAKLGLSLGRAVLRPSAERPSTVYAKYPTLLVKDLVEHYEELFPPLIHAKAKESDMKALSPFRNVPIRRRSTLVDQRISRSSLQSAGFPSDGLQRRAAQYEQLHGARSPLARHTSLSYRPAHGAERAARTSRIASAHASMQAATRTPAHAAPEPPVPKLPPAAEAPAEPASTAQGTRPDVRPTEDRAEPRAEPRTEHTKTPPADEAHALRETPREATQDAPRAQAPSTSDEPSPLAPALELKRTDSSEAPRFQTRKIESHKPEIVKAKPHRAPPTSEAAKTEAAPLREPKRRLPKLPVPPLPSDSPTQSPVSSTSDTEAGSKPAPTARPTSSLSQSSTVRGPRGPRTAS